MQSLVGSSLAALFFEQGAADQAHGLESARSVELRAPSRRDLQAAALLHDIGKRHAHLGPIGRSLATLAEALRLPRTPRMRTYLDHGPGAVAELEEAGADRVVVAFARHHHSGRPGEIAAEDWELLLAADRD